MSAPVLPPEACAAAMMDVPNNSFDTFDTPPNDELFCRRSNFWNKNCTFVVGKKE